MTADKSVLLQEPGAMSWGSYGGQAVPAALQGTGQGLVLKAQRERAFWQGHAAAKKLTHLTSSANAVHSSDSLG